MTWFGWLLVGNWAAASLSAVWRVGRPAKPVSPAAAMVAVLIDAALIVGVLAVGTGRL